MHILDSFVNTIKKKKPQITQHFNYSLENYNSSFNKKSHSMSHSRLIKFLPFTKIDDLFI